MGHGTEESLVILTSGGLDSLIAHYFARNRDFENIRGLWVDLNHPYREKEEHAIKHFPFEIDTLRCPTVHERFQNVPTVDQQVIPGRNLLLAVLAASVGATRVWLCALDGEQHPFALERDKTPEFFDLTTGLMTFIFKSRSPRVIVETPFKNMSKTEIVRWALDHDVPHDVILGTSTCYHEALWNCGECSACFKRWVALENNDLHDAFLFDPWESEYAKDQIGKMLDALNRNDFSHYSLKRIEDVFDALNMQKPYNGGRDHGRSDRR